MSFSNQLKNNLATINGKNCCKLAELAGLIKMDGNVLISNSGKVLLEIISENLNVARKSLSLINEKFQVDNTILVQQNNRLKKNISYIIRIPNQEKVSKLLYTLGLQQDGLFYTTTIPNSFIANPCCSVSYLRGVFLGSGYISNPEQSYHLEIVTKSEDYAGELIKLMEQINLQPKYTIRNYQVVVYLKEIEQIISCIEKMGSINYAQQINHVRLAKLMRNNINRSINCETANINKAIHASSRQIEQIQHIETTLGLGNINKNLKELAIARLEYPDLSLKELGEMMSPQLSKSAVNHRMRRIEAIADKI